MAGRVAVLCTGEAGLRSGNVEHPFKWDLASEAVRDCLRGTRYEFISSPDNGNSTSVESLLRCAFGSCRNRFRCIMKLQKHHFDVTLHFDRYNHMHLHIRHRPQTELLYALLSLATVERRKCPMSKQLDTKHVVAAAHSPCRAHPRVVVGQLHAATKSLCYRDAVRRVDGDDAGQTNRLRKGTQGARGRISSGPRRKRRKRRKRTKRRKR